MATMRALNIEKTSPLADIKLSNMPKPKPGKDEVLIKLYASSLTSVEADAIKGDLEGFFHFPEIIGIEGAGVVEEVGQEVKDCKVGDRVAISASHARSLAQYTVVKNVLLLPDKMSFQEGAAYIGSFMTAYYGLKQRINARAGQTILVQGGSGALGNSAVQVAKSCGLRVFSTASTTAGLEIAKKAGADQVFNYRDADFMDKVKAAAGEKGIDIIFEVFIKANFQNDIELLNRRGTLLIFGDMPEPSGRIPTRSMIMKEIQIQGLIADFVTGEGCREIENYLKVGVDAGWAWPIIDKVFPFEEISKAFICLEERRKVPGKIVIDIKH